MTRFRLLSDGRPARIRSDRPPAAAIPAAAAAAAAAAEACPPGPHRPSEDPGQSPAAAAAAATVPEDCAGPSAAGRAGRPAVPTAADRAEAPAKGKQAAAGRSGGAGQSLAAPHPFRRVSSCLASFFSLSLPPFILFQWMMTLSPLFFLPPLSTALTAGVFHSLSLPLSLALSLPPSLCLSVSLSCSLPLSLSGGVRVATRGQEG